MCGKGLFTGPGVAGWMSGAEKAVADLVRDICRMVPEQIKLLTARLAGVSAKLATVSRAATRPLRPQTPVTSALFVTRGAPLPARSPNLRP